ncbi:MAG: hypothetical protein ABIR79_22065, partial [Candidatus Binatia bacterium]
MADGERLGGGWLVAASVLLWLSWSLMPGVGVTDTRQILERVALQRDAVWLSVVLQLVSAACFAGPLVTLHRLGHVRGSRALRVGAVLLTIGAMGSAADAIYHLLAYYMTAPGMNQDALVPLMQKMQGPGLAVLIPMVLAFFAGVAATAVGAANVGLVSRRNPWLFALALIVAFSAPIWVRINPNAARGVGLTVLGLISLSLAGIGLGMAPHLTARRLVLGMVLGFLVMGFATYIAGEQTEVVVLRTRDDAGIVHETEMWCVDHEGTPWVRVANAERHWYQRLVAHPEVELVRHGDATPRVAHPDPAPATRLAVDQVFAAKYGLVDFWYGAILRRGPIPIRLDPR